jgi:uncharacterized protein
MAAVKTSFSISSTGPAMKEIVRILAQQLVNNPDAVEVTETRGDSTTLLELRVAKEDLGRVIGKEGRTAHSSRTILNAVAARNKRRVTLEIKE